MTYTYKDFVTGKIKHTRGKFEQWTEPMGPLHARYAIFKNTLSFVSVPEYCLTKETKEKLKEVQ